MNVSGFTVAKGYCFFSWNNANFIVASPFQAINIIIPLSLSLSPSPLFLSQAGDAEVDDGGLMKYGRVGCTGSGVFIQKSCYEV